MGLLDGIEKLITEHGSAAILKERIALANDKYAALESKAAELEAKNKTLLAKIGELSGKLAMLEQQVAAQAGVGAREEIEERMLVLVAQHGEVHRDGIARALAIGGELAEYHLNELTEADLLHVSYSSIDPTTWSLAQEGRRYLVRRKLLK